MNSEAALILTKINVVNNIPLSEDDVRLSPPITLSEDEPEKTQIHLIPTPQSDAYNKPPIYYNRINLNDVVLDSVEILGTGATTTHDLLEELNTLFDIGISEISIENTDILPYATNMRVVELVAKSDSYIFYGKVLIHIGPKDSLRDPEKDDTKLHYLFFKGGEVEDYKTTLKSFTYLGEVNRYFNPLINISNVTKWDISYARLMSGNLMVVYGEFEFTSNINAEIVAQSCESFIIDEYGFVVDVPETLPYGSSVAGISSDKSSSFSYRLNEENKIVRYFASGEVDRNFTTMFTCTIIVPSKSGGLYILVRTPLGVDLLRLLQTGELDTSFRKVEFNTPSVEFYSMVVSDLDNVYLYVVPRRTLSSTYCDLVINDVSYIENPHPAFMWNPIVKITKDGFIDPNWERMMGRYNHEFFYVMDANPMTPMTPSTPDNYIILRDGDVLFYTNTYNPKTGAVQLELLSLNALGVFKPQLDLYSDERWSKIDHLLKISNGDVIISGNTQVVSDNVVKEVKTMSLLDSTNKESKFLRSLNLENMVKMIVVDTSGTE